MTTKHWKRVQPNSLRHAMELCVEYARAKHNRSVERIAELMGVSSHWAVYKWLQSGKLPANLVLPFEQACGASFVTTYLTHAAGKLAVDIPTGRKSTNHEINYLQVIFADTLSLLIRYYDDRHVGTEETQNALMTVMESLAWHKANVMKHQAPELDFSKEEHHG